MRGSLCICVSLSGVCHPTDWLPPASQSQSLTLIPLNPNPAMPLMDIVRLDTMVTVVDSGVFLDAYVSRDKLANRPELGTWMPVPFPCP